MNWFKLYSEFATDPKVQSMTEAMQRRLVMIFCLECSGDLPKLEDHELAQAMRINHDELIRTHELFVRKGFIGEDSWSPRKWEARQSPSDPAAAERMRKLREKRKNESEQLRERSANVRPNITRTGKERSRSVPRTKAERSGRVTPDTRSRELETETEEEKDRPYRIPGIVAMEGNGTVESTHAIPTMREELARRSKHRRPGKGPATIP